MNKVTGIALSLAVAAAAMPSMAACSSPNTQSTADGTLVAQASSKAKKAKASMKVKATKSKIKISLNKVGSSGTATVYRFRANQYPKKDKLSGLVKKNSKGSAVGTYKCGGKKTISVDRFLKSGYDTMFSKYYVMKGSKILKGPIYATSYASARTKTLTFKHKSKKAYSEEVTGTSTYKMTRRLGAESAVITINATNLIYPNENAGGAKISYQGRTDVIAFPSNGKTYYFKKAYVHKIDKLVRKFSKAKINLTAAVWAYTTGDWNWYPKSLVYTRYNRATMAYNTKGGKGLGYFVALMEFLGSRYSKSDQRILTFIVGNETDLAHDWGRLRKSNKRVPLNKYMEEYSRGLRLANLAVKKCASSMKVAMSTSNSWAKNRYTAMGGRKFYGKNTLVKNSYAAKSLVDWLCKHEKARGNYDWAYAPHAYDISTSHAEYLKNDMRRIKHRNYKIITASWKTSPWLTTANTEIIQQYMNVGAHRYKGKTRSVYLTESAVSSYDYSKTCLRRQAVTVAQYYYRAASLPCVKQVAYYTYTTKDKKGYPNTKLFGMYKKNGKKKPIYKLWKKIDTKSSFKVSNKYLKYLNYYNRKGRYCSVSSGNIRSYYDVMFASNPSYNWKKHWAFKKYVKPVRA